MAPRPSANLAEVAVRQIKTEPRCKLCKNPNRAEIDDWLLRRSFRSVTPDGTAVNLGFVQERMRELGVENPTRENIVAHWKNHCEVVSRTEQEAVDEAVKELFESLTPEQVVEMSSDQLLDLLQKQGFLELQAKVVTTGKSGVTLDHIIRIAELKNRQKASEAQGRLMDALGGGIRLALEKAHEPKELPPAHPDLEAEVVREPEGVEAA